MLTNYHTHHDRCRHAIGTVEDYVREACRLGYAEIGMSCHVPFEKLDWLQGTRMYFHELDLYFADIQQAKEDFPQISILKSLECEYFPEVHDYLEKLYHETDYLVLGQHYIQIGGKIKDAFHFTKPKQLLVYAEYVERALETGFFKVLAHPDVFMCLYPAWDDTCAEVSRRLIRAAISAGAYLEVNANGFRRGLKTYKDGTRYPYPSENFWRIVSEEFGEAPVLINSDCHEPGFLNDEYVAQAREFARKLRLNVVTDRAFQTSKKQGTVLSQKGV